jgi:CRP-like cAMP-binding protein
MCEGQYIYQEGDKINSVYFVNHGLCGYSLPRYHSLYIKIEPGDMFGIVDIVYNEKKQKNKLHSKQSMNQDDRSQENFLIQYGQ